MPFQAKTIETQQSQPVLFYLLGLIFLILNKIRHTVSGYKTPRPFSSIDMPKAANYDIEVIASWEKFLNSYTNNQFSWQNQNVLEMGPGADLGVGLILLSKGASKYNAVDIHNLIKTTPSQFYDHLLASLPREKTDFLQNQLKLTIENQNDKLNYLYQPDFDLSVLKDEQIDVIVSQAAFEHFDDVGKTISQISKLAKPGSLLVAEIDLKTHTRWIREKDPLNIYRYSDNLYNLFKFKGSPNRLRPYHYEQILKANGWTNIQITPDVILDSKYLAKVQPTLNRQFTDSSSQMDYLSIIICATKS